LLPLESTIMFDEYEKKRRDHVSLMRSILDYGIGTLIMLAGVFFIVRDKFDFAINESYPPNDMQKIFGIVCVLYGGWRIYRGYKKNYFK
jgi:hypothetical protein